MPNSRTPAVVGVGQFLNHIEPLEDAIEPIEMMLRAGARRTPQDAPAGILRA